MGNLASQIKTKAFGVHNRTISGCSTSRSSYLPAFWAVLQQPNHASLFLKGCIAAAQPSQQLEPEHTPSLMIPVSAMLPMPKWSMQLAINKSSPQACHGNSFLQRHDPAKYESIAWREKTSNAPNIAGHPA